MLNIDSLGMEYCSYILQGDFSLLEKHIPHFDKIKLRSDVESMPIMLRECILSMLIFNDNISPIINFDISPSTFSIISSVDKQKGSIKSEFYTTLRNLYEKTFVYDNILLSILSEYIQTNVLFLNHKHDNTLDALYKHAKNSYETETQKNKHKQHISLDEIFEIINTINLLLTNTAICLKNNEKNIRYCSPDVNIVEILNVLAQIDSQKKISNTANKYKQIIESHDKFLDKMPQPVRLASRIATTLNPIPVFNHDHIVQKEKKAIYTENKFHYFAYTLLSTYCKNEEVKARYGYVW